MSAVKNHALGGVEASMAIARITLKRTLRGKSLWIVLCLCILPEIFGLLALRSHDLAAWRDVFGMSSLLMALVPPILLASTIGEEIEEKTMAYLWSRPLPRWSILLGKVVALVPILWLMLAAAMTLPFFTAIGPEASSRLDLLWTSLLAVVIGTTAASCVTAGLATLAPRFGTVLALGYLLLIDGTLAALDTSISKLSVAYNSLQLSGADGTPAYGAIGWMIGIGAVWMSVAVWRIRRIE